MQTKFLSLVNIISGREIVPEFMPYFSSIDPIVEKIEQLLKDKKALTQTSSELVDLAQPLGKESASENVTKFVVNMIG